MKFSKLRRAWLRWKLLKGGGRLLLATGFRTYSVRLGLCRSILWVPRVSEIDAAWRQEVASINAEHQKALAETKRGLADVVAKLVKLSIQGPDYTEPSRYRLVIDLDPFTIREAFLYGNDDTMIRFFSEQIGHMAYRELKTVNMQRFRDQPFQGYRASYERGDHRSETDGEF